MNNRMKHWIERSLWIGALLITCGMVGASWLEAQVSNPRVNNRVVLNSRPANVLASSAQTCRVDKLKLVFQTGNDDLRGGQNNLNVEIHFADGSMQKADNVNHSANWPNNNINSLAIPLNRQVAPNEIKQIRLVHLAQGGYSPQLKPGPGVPVDLGISAAAGIKTEDNWNMTQFQAFGQGPNIPNIPIASAGMHRFTGSDPALEVNTRSDAACPSGNAVRELELVFHTGNDDLRGGDDNVGVTIHFADGTTQAAANVNRGQRWANGSTHDVALTLNRPASIDQIRSISLETTVKGGTNGDNWNMDSVEISADTRPLTTYGFHRFSSNWNGPNAKDLTIPLK
jgi:hypothetical protein